MKNSSLSSIVNGLSTVVRWPWERRGALTQMGLGAAKIYVAFSLNSVSPNIQKGDVMDQFMTGDSSQFLPTLAYLWTLGTGLCGDIMNGALRARFAKEGMDATRFVTFETGLYHTLMGHEGYRFISPSMDAKYRGSLNSKNRNRKDQ